MCVLKTLACQGHAGGFFKHLSIDSVSVCFENERVVKMPSTFFRLAKSGRAKGAAKGSCGETVVQKGVFGESVSSLPP